MGNEIKLKRGLNQVKDTYIVTRRSAVALGLLGVLLSCGPNLSPSESECKAFREKVRNLPQVKRFTEIPSRGVAALANDFVTFDRSQPPNFVFKRVSLSGEEKGSVSVQPNSMLSLSSLTTISVGTSLATWIPNTGVFIVEPSMATHLYPDSSKRELMAAFGDRYTRATDTQVISYPGEIVDFSKKADSTVQAFLAVARNGDSVCAVELATSVRVHCKGPSGEYFLSTESLTALSKSSFNSVAMTPHHFLWETSQRTVLAAPLERDGTFSALKVPNGSAVLLRKLNAYCGAIVDGEDSTELNASYYYWSGGEAIKLPVDGLGLQLTEFALSYSSSDFSVPDIFVHQF